MYISDSVDSKRLLYTPSSFAKTSLLHLQEVGSLTALKPHTSMRENLNSYLFFIVTSGSGKLRFGDEEYELTVGDCAFVDCRKSYAHSTSNDNLWSLKWVHFYGPNLSSIYAKYAERGGKACFSAQDKATYGRFMDELFALAGSDDYIRDMRINEKLAALLTVIMSESWNSEKRPVDTKRRNVQDVKEYIDEHYMDKIVLDELAERFYVSKFYLTRLFKEQFGSSVNNYIIHVRITHAKELLRFSDQSVEGIGAKCGMEDANYFARMFRKVEGISPTEYRKQW